MDLIEQFVSRYRKEFDFYDQTARLAAQLVEQNLQSAGIRAIVTARAKSTVRLDQKVRQRGLKKQYKSVEEIFQDIVDLAGVRIALYFPGERDQVGKVIVQLFALDGEPREFPEKDKPSTYAKRFSGYWATHYRVRHRENSLSDAQKRYAEALIEIQVASVLMHSWAEVEHDLVYKPMQGALSDDEYAILDELNGLVMSGEIALERLQRAGESRVAAKGRTFSNHYELAAHILSEAAETASSDAILGRISVLFDLLKATNKATPDALQPYLESLTTDFERRPIADQIIDKLLAESPKRYDIYSRLKIQDAGDRSAVVGEPRIDDAAKHASMGRFLYNWIKFERLIRRMAESRSASPIMRLSIPSSSLIRGLELLDQESLAQVDQLRRFRNMLVHGIELPSQGAIDDATRSLRLILERLEPQGGPPRARQTKRKKRQSRNK
jgi:ppGpp synthetase/RelA/SpoT-type nucleotidyltranferase